MKETEIDEVDLLMMDIIALLKGYGIKLSVGKQILDERLPELWPEVDPAPTHDAPHALQ